VDTPGELARVGEYRGVGVYPPALDSVEIGFMYVPVRPGRGFQP
jgi:hypothetical protein